MFLADPLCDQCAGALKVLLNGNGAVKRPEQAGNAASVLVVILNYNGLTDTLACLESLRRQDWSKMDVLVIDNGSKNIEGTRISELYADVHVKIMQDNLGWAGGNNIGIKFALENKYDHICLLNNDTVLAPNAITELVLAADRIVDPCLLHPAIAYFDDPTNWQLRPEPDYKKSNAEILMRYNIVEMNWAYGACLFMSASVPEKIGLLDERFFLQMEETDYFLRAKSFGINAFCARRAEILHKESASFEGKITPNKTYYIARNTFLLAEKHTLHLSGYLRTARSLVWSLHNQAQLGKSVWPGWISFAVWAVSSDALAFAARQGVADYLRRRFGRRPDVRQNT